IVPYRVKEVDVAQFQIMAKGFIQLAIRTGQYKAMNYTEIYEDELKSYNPITKEIVFEPNITPNSQREKGMEEKIVGYYS
ncbi:recombinase, partial [Escherichia coli]|uniref:recombinase RecT n=1 Tax=Escherichia coli TaxID=562 RepID=UPI00139C55CE